MSSLRHLEPLYRDRIAKGLIGDWYSDLAVNGTVTLIDSVLDRLLFYRCVGYGELRALNYAALLDPVLEQRGPRNLYLARTRLVEQIMSALEQPYLEP